MPSRDSVATAVPSRLKMPAIPHISIQSWERPRPPGPGREARFAVSRSKFELADESDFPSSVGAGHGHRSSDMGDATACLS